MTERQEIVNYIQKTYGAAAERPWVGYPGNLVFRHEDNQKWFGLIMDVKREVLGLPGDDIVDVMNVKLDPVLVDILREQEGFRPAYHMNKRSWITILLDGSVELEQIYDLIDQSYAETASKKTKREKHIGPRNWLIPANPKYFDVVAAFETQEIIRWKQSSDIHVGDIVYMYVGAPYSAILYKCKALEVNIPYDGHREDLNIKKVMSIQLLKKYDPEEWTFARIRNYDVRAVRGPRSMPDELMRDMDRVADVEETSGNPEDTKHV